MPYVSQAQEAYFHAHKEELEKQGVDVSEWDKASKGLKLPKKVGTKHKTQNVMRISKPGFTQKQVDVKHKASAVGQMHSIHKHSSAHHKMSVAEMHEHHMHKMHPAHKAHPMHKHYKAGISNVRHADGVDREMKMSA